MGKTKSGLMGLLKEVAENGDDPIEVLIEVEKEITDMCVEKFGKETVQRGYDLVSQKILHEHLKEYAKEVTDMVDGIIEELGIEDEEDSSIVMYVVLMSYVFRMQYLSITSTLIDNTFNFNYITSKNPEKDIELLKTVVSDEELVKEVIKKAKGSSDGEDSEEEDEKHLPGYV